MTKLWQVGHKDRDEILDWMAAHRLLDFTGLPRVGFRTKTMACFLNQCEMKICFIDHLVKKPGSSHNEEDGIECVNACTQWAKQNGFTYVFATSSLKHVVKYAHLCGFELWPHKYLVRRI